MTEQSTTQPEGVAQGLVPGASVIIDGKVLTFSHYKGVVGVALSEKGKECRFDAREVTAMGNGFFTLPGRTDVPKQPTATVVTEPAVAIASGGE